MKRLVINRDQFISKPTDFKLTETDFELVQDSTILVREPTRGSKLEGAYKKRKRILLEQTDYTVTFLPAGNKQPTIISKRDIAREDGKINCAAQKGQTAGYWQVAAKSTQTKNCHTTARPTLKLMYQSKRLTVSRQNNQSE